MSYTTILHSVRLKLGLSLTDYCIADYIFRMAANPCSKVPGWCYASKRKIGEDLGLSKTWVIKAIAKLEEDGIVEKHPDDTRLVRTTQTWYDLTQVTLSTKDTIGEQSSPLSVNKIHRIGEQSSPPSDNNSNINNDNTTPLPPSGENTGVEENLFEKEKNTDSDLGGGDAEARAAKFRAQVWAEGAMTYTAEMLTRFYDYWTELDRGKKPKMRFEKQKVFEIRKRLNVWATKNLDRIECYLTVEQQRTITQKKRAFSSQLAPYLSRYGKHMLNNFYRHWSQPENVENPTRLKWECEEFWDLSNRLAMWHEREKKQKLN